ncbi:MAG: ATP-binding protein [Xanthomonadales bacterium]
MSSNSITDGTNPLDVLMAVAADAIIIIDSKGVILRFNQAAEQIFVYTAEEVCGRNVSMLMPEPHGIRQNEYIKRYLKTGQATVIGLNRDVTGAKSDGSTFPIKLSLGEVKREDGSRFIAIIHDLSEKRAGEAKVRQLEEQLVHADRLVILGELTAGIAHEINQPLTAIAAYADAGRQLAQRKGDTSPENIHLICERIAEQSRRVAEVVQRLRRLVRTGSISKAHHDINEIIKNTILLFEYETKKKYLKFDFYPEKGIDILYVDEIQIQQILVNLVKNGLDAISAAGQDEGRITIRVKKVGKVVAIEVQDNGPGVAQADRHHLFESFFTTKPQGVGLGLSICKNIAAAHGGNLRYESPAEGGSRFTLTLPLEHIA